MKRIVVASDSFKGSLASTEICEIAQDVLSDAIARGQLAADEIELSCLPIADGGEGTLESVAFALGDAAQIVSCEVTGPFADERIVARYLLTDDKTAIIEAAQCVGLPLVYGRENTAEATTVGVGQLMLDALDHGAQRLMLGLGGSASTDAGCGMAHALGARFHDESGNDFVPIGSTLQRIAHVDASRAQELMQGIDVVAMCDVDNPLFGPRGAAYIFAPQKGASSHEVELLDVGLAHIATFIDDCAEIGSPVSAMPGAGAAGGLGAGIVAFAGGSIESGIACVLELLRMNENLTGATLAVTGEGRFDMQSLAGKAPIGVAREAAELGVPVLVLAGQVDNAVRSYIDVHPELGIMAIHQISADGMPFEQTRLCARKDYAAAFRRYALGIS